ncbi:cell envelope integrity EipB family protein [Rhizobiaceae bacterium BDR2-2]|uniref:Cell envelope integrity EipB family protein n=1 Tax=Ectorhizobium quercum TaxID=2965071 RepID=A0AAE3N0H1_9HYPH|nr:cell envelope integrity EipB family protein [Ectorhizobium quercum]MCX8997621.1 cell envelope integrity EipB family protein [Ectorhizobium quercum]
MVGGKLVSVVVLIAATTGARAENVPAPPLQPHRAVYDLELQDASERSGIDAIYGRMVYEFTGAACKGYTTRFRFATRIVSGDDLRLSDQRLTSFEDVAAGTYRFENQAFTDETLEKEVKGTATRGPDGVTVELEGDPSKTVELPPSIFPTAHMQEVIANALKGTPLFDARTFDGSEDGDKALLVTTIIGKPQTGGDEETADAKAASALSAKPWWPVTASYFNEAPEGDAEPTYRLSFKLYDNGVSRDLVMDYGDFALTGKLAKLDLLPEEACEPPETP